MDSVFSPKSLSSNEFWNCVRFPSTSVLLAPVAQQFPRLTRPNWEADSSNRLADGVGSTERRPHSFVWVRRLARRSSQKSKPQTQCRQHLQDDIGRILSGASYADNNHELLTHYEQGSIRQPTTRFEENLTNRLGEFRSFRGKTKRRSAFSKLVNRLPECQAAAPCGDLSAIHSSICRTIKPASSVKTT